MLGLTLLSIGAMYIRRKQKNPTRNNKKEDDITHLYDGFVRYDDIFMTD
jgi:hypothetical protein